MASDAVAAATDEDDFNGDEDGSTTSSYSPVFLFTHRSELQRTNDYVRIMTQGNHSLVVTGTHLIYVNGGLAPAKRTMIGDRVLTLSGWKSVTALHLNVHARGLYNPQTLHGNIIVDGFVVSTFTQAVPVRIAVGLLMPLRALFRASIISESVAGRWFQLGVFVS